MCIVCYNPLDGRGKTVAVKGYKEQLKFQSAIVYGNGDSRSLLVNGLLYRRVRSL